ncbi:MAG: FAD-binding protein [Thermoguttaceae bacterium]|nr:FAD-binding protein [Thermoguttaceae bacterium]
MKKHVHTLIIGSGAAGLAAALQLHRNGISDILIATESLAGGTSINTGSDKQTYYKLSLCGNEADSIRSMAETFFNGGSMHGDLALAEAANSVRAFMNLVELGLPFPADEFGQFVGYKTDHDPRQRATSIGPYTSREMCRALIRELQKLQVPIQEGLFVKELLIDYDTRKTEVNAPIPPSGKICGARFFQRSEEVQGNLADENADRWDVIEILAENVVFAVGGPGGLYRTSVYPKVHTGAIGVALQAGALAQNLPESQFGLASIGFRWNVSGTFMQVVPSFISTEQDGSNPKEFLEEYANFPGELLPLVFLKGYQWPFDSRKTVLKNGVVRNWGSSMVDIWVYVETVLRGRRVWLDFRKNPTGYSRENIGEEAWNYLEKSEAANLETPLGRLEKMNPEAIQMYADHHIDIRSEMLEIAVCAQHNNGGLAADVNWESLNIRGLFPIGEVNGSHGVYRPGGSALNSGQVAAIRAAGKIARGPSYDAKSFTENQTTEPLPSVLETVDWINERRELQERMTRAGGFLRRMETIENALCETKNRMAQIRTAGMQSQRNAYLLRTEEVYLEAIRFQLQSGVGSRGSAIVLTDKISDDEQNVIELDGKKVAVLPENETFRNFVQETWFDPEYGTIVNRWVPRRDIPEPDSWFENVWRMKKK